jgi:3-deoxy-D-manno-octulosonic-acid transferase
MEDFAEAKRILEAGGGGMEVSSSDVLAQRILELLETPGECRRRGAAGRQAVLDHLGAATRHVRALASLWEGVP